MFEKMGKKRAMIFMSFLASILIVLVIPSKESFIFCGVTLGLVFYDMVLSDYHWYERQITNANTALLWDYDEMERLKGIIEKLGGDWHK